MFATLIHVQVTDLQKTVIGKILPNHLVRRSCCRLDRAGILFLSFSFRRKRMFFITWTRNGILMINRSSSFPFASRKNHGSFILPTSQIKTKRKFNIFFYQTTLLTLCSFNAVNGGWSSWFVSTPCNVTCGSGKEELNRTCTNPEPKHGGNPCNGVSHKEQKCTRKPCPSKKMSSL